MHSNSKNPKYRPNCSEKELQNIHYETFPSINFSDDHKESNNIELCIEVEIEDSLKDLLSSPEKCKSTLLDVTVIKPKELDYSKRIETNTLKGTQVRNLIANIERQKREEKLISEILEEKGTEHETIIKVCRHKPRRNLNVYSDFGYDSTVRDRHKQTLNKLQKSIRTKKIDSSSAPVDSISRKRDTNCFAGITSLTPPAGEYRRMHKDPRGSLESAGGVEPTDCEEYPPLLEFSNFNFKGGDDKKTHQVYTTARTFRDIDPVLTCTNNSKNSVGPCLCNRCGIAGLLSESQKRPIVTAPVEHPNDLRRNRRDCSRHDRPHRASESLTNEDKNIQVAFLNLLDRIKSLEERMEVQEERAVPKDYFKRIITKLIAHFSPRIITARNDSSYRLNDGDSDESTQYKNKCSVNAALIEGKLSPRQGGSNAKTDKKKGRAKEGELINLISNLADNITSTKHESSYENAWKWGGEILKPGIDLKNKIMSLLEVALQQPKKTEAELVKPIKSAKSSNSKPSKHTDVKNEIDSDIFKNFVEAMSARIYNNHKKDKESKGEVCKKSSMLDTTKSQIADGFNQSNSDSSLYTKNTKKKEVLGSTITNFQKSSTIKKNPSQKPQSKNKSQQGVASEGAKRLNISYLNPKLSAWQEEESQLSFTLERSEDAVTRQKVSKQRNKESEKLEFLRTLSRTKDSDKEKLWESIWAQAKANGQTKKDKVTIQLPRLNETKHFNDMIELEFSIGDIEIMLTKHKYANGRHPKQESASRDKPKH